jgi:hypothetical protein
LTQGELEADGPEIARYLAELVVGSHQEDACKGDNCFCKLAPQVFDKPDQQAGAALCAARSCSSLAAAARKRGRNLEQAEAATAAKEAREKRRSKAYWAARERAAAGGIIKVAFGGLRSEKPGGAAVSEGCKENGALAVSGVREGFGGAAAVSGEREGPGRAAVSGRREGSGGAAMNGTSEPLRIPVCSRCTCPLTVCPHGISDQTVPVLLMEADGVQREVPKLARPTDTWDVHDALVEALRDLIRVSELANRDFAELSAGQFLSAPCPRAAPPCRTRWIGLWQSGHVFSLEWSQEVG